LSEIGPTLNWEEVKQGAEIYIRYSTSLGNSCQQKSTDIRNKGVRSGG
jgi:hypothetical protein